MILNENVAVFVSIEETKVIAGCMLITPPNLLPAWRLHRFSKML
jgi:hypothetical protein